MKADEEISAGQHVLNAAGNQMNQLAPTAAGVALGAVRDYFADQRRQKYYKENQEALFKYGQLAQRNAASNMVEGLKKAGLSPALATDASGMSTASASMPSGSSGSAVPNPDAALVGTDKAMAYSSMLTQQKQRDLLQSEVDLNNARTEGQQIVNRREEGADYVGLQMWDSTIDGLVRDAEAMGDKNAAAAYEAIRNIDGPIVNQGFYDALRSFGVTSSSFSENSVKRVSAYIENKISAAKEKHPEFFEAMAIAPYLENAKVRAQIGELGAMTLKLASDVDVNKAMLPEIAQKIEQIKNEMEHTDIDDAIAKHNDLAGMLKDGDVVGASVYIAEGAAKFAAQALGLYFGGKALAAKKAAGKAGEVLAPEGSPRNLNQSLDTNYKYSPQKVGETKAGEKKAEVSKIARERGDRANAQKAWNKFYKEYKREHRSPTF